MEKTVIMGETEVVLRASAGVLVIYKEQFGTEYINDLAELKENEENERAIDIGGKLIWAMAKAHDDKTPPPVEFYEEVGSFDMSGVFASAADLFDRSCEGIKEISDSDGSEQLTAEELVTSALLCKMTVADLNKMSLAMVINIISDYCAIKSGEGITREATQRDYDNF